MDNTQTWTAPIFFDLDKINLEKEEEQIILDYTPPVILPENVSFENYEALAEPTLEPINLSHSVISPWLWLTGTLGLFLGLMLLVNTYQFIFQQYENNFFVGSLFLILIMVIVGIISNLSWQSYQKIQSLRTVSDLQKEGNTLLTSDAYGNTTPYFNKIVNFYADRPDIKDRLELFYTTLNDSHQDRDVCKLFSNIVLKDIDKQAYQIVNQRSKETALMVMISQIAILDAILTLWRNVRLIRDVSILYGSKPGFLGTIALISSLIQNLIYADVSEMVAEGMAEILGGSVLSIMSAQVAQGIGSGVLTARLGLQTMKSCRPLPFTDKEKPRLKKVRKELVISLKSFFEKKAA